MRIAINGFGRIGRAVFKIALEKGINVVAINNLGSASDMAYLLKYDSVYGPYKKEVKATNDALYVGNKKVLFFSERDPEKLPWKKLKIDVVVESTGIFRDKEGASKHIKAGAKRVLISAPSNDPDVMVVLGVNDKDLKKEHKIISMASCTTNCLAPIVKCLNDKFGIEKGYMTTVHAYTGDQVTLDTHHKKLRRGRAAGINLVPTTSGAATAVTKVIPSLKGKLDGMAIRAPVACGSIVDFSAILKKKATVDEINRELRKIANTKLKGILDYTEDEIVSSDIIGNPHSSIVDGKLTQANGKFVKVYSWYDNEWGYSNRMVDLLQRLK